MVNQILRLALVVIAAKIVVDYADQICKDAGIKRIHRH